VGEGMIPKRTSQRVSRVSPQKRDEGKKVASRKATSGTVSSATSVYAQKAKRDQLSRPGKIVESGMSLYSAGKAAKAAVDWYTKTGVKTIKTPSKGVPIGFAGRAAKWYKDTAVKGTNASSKSATITNKDIGATTKGVSKKTGGVLKNSKPVTYGPRKPTAAQVATQRRQIAAKKAAATRRANAARVQDTRAKVSAARRANAAKKKK